MALVVKNLPAREADGKRLGAILGWGRSPAWQATVHRVA